MKLYTYIQNNILIYDKYNMTYYYFNSNFNTQPF